MQMEFILWNYPCIGSERYGNVGGADISSDIRPNIGNATYHVGDVTLDANVGGADTSRAQANSGLSTQISY